LRRQLSTTNGTRVALPSAQEDDMFPLGDDRVPGGPPPLVTLGLVILNVLAFLFEVSQPSGALQSFIQAWGVVPREYTLARDIAPTIPLPFWSTLLTSMFLHGGWMHLGGNMLYLWIFGDNLEKVMGHARFVFFYLACGIAAGLAHILFSGASNVPTVGASGAISGVLGGYLVLFPRNQVRVLTRGGIVAVPAIVVLGFWIVIQLINGVGSLAVTTDNGGVAYMAHIGGFIAGIVLVKLLATRRPATA
jgi:membrane associated rhomboid family serine protease